MQHDFILLDRSGSMSSLWNEALNSVNAYVKKLADERVDTGVTLATFDRDGEQFKFEVIRDRITPPTWKPVSSDDAHPRGLTPLNDAIGRIVALAKVGCNGVQYAKLALIIMTDGLENASHEFSHEAAKVLLDDCRAKNWQVIFLGANFDNAAQAMSYGAIKGQTVNSSTRNLSGSMALAASARSRYGATGDAMLFTEEQRAKAAQQ
jgi:hypothetical protein